MQRTGWWQSGGVLGLLALLILGLARSAWTAAPPAVTEAWVARYSGPGNEIDFARKMTVDGTGNVYVTGQSTGSGTGLDYATVKYDAAGSQQWVARYNGPQNGHDQAWDLAVDEVGSVYVTGNSFALGTGFNYATVKYDANGTQQWVAHYNGPANGTDVPRALAVDSVGGVYVTGFSESSANDRDYATVKYDANGAQEWVARYNGPGDSHDEPQSLAIDKEGNTYVTGASEFSAVDRDYTTVKYDAAGSQQWVARYNGSQNGYDQARDLAVDEAGSVYVTGSSFAPATGFDYVTVKYVANGAQQWVARYNGSARNDDGAWALALDGAGSVYVLGNSYGGSDTGSDYATVKYDGSGSQQWAARYNGPENGSESAQSLAVDGAGNVYVSGFSIPDGMSSDYVTVKYAQRPPNSPPVVQSDKTLIAAEDAAPISLGITTPTDEDNDPLTIIVNTVPSAAQGNVVKADNTAVAVNSALTSLELVSLQFHVAPDSNGAAGAFQYTVTDGKGGCVTQTVALHIIPLNDPPNAVGDTYSGWRGCPLTISAPGVLWNDGDVEGNALTASVVLQPTGGAVTLSPNGSFKYVPNTGTISDSFTYRVYDGSDHSAPATVNLTLATDTTPPTGTVSTVVTESTTRVYLPLTAGDEQSGVARVKLTPVSTNCRLEWDGPFGLVTAPINTPVTISPAAAITEVRVVKLNPNRISRVEVQVTDCVGNSTLVSPVIAQLELKRGKVLVRTFKKLPPSAHYLLLQNGIPGFTQVQIRVNGKSAYTGALTAGQALRRDLAAQMLAAKNTVQVRLTGYRVSTAVFTLADTAPTASSGRAVSRGQNLEFAP